MTATEKNIATFETRTRQMILRFMELKKQNEELTGLLEKTDGEMEVLRRQLAQSQADYQSLKTAKMLEVTDGDISSAKDKLSKLIRDVNKCIAILSDERES